MVALPASVEDIHPALWRGSQLARGQQRVVATGHERLSRELPGAGWPRGALIELLAQHSGVGELRLLAPALARASEATGRPIVFLQPPQLLNAAGLAFVGIPPARAMLLTPSKAMDALWSAEQVLRAGTCAALLFWQQRIRAESLRRLHLAARSGETLFVMLRPLHAAIDASPAELRLTVHPSSAGAEIRIIKRRGPTGDGPFHVPLRAASLLNPYPTARRLFKATQQARKTLAPVDA